MKPARLPLAAALLAAAAARWQAFVQRWLIADDPTGINAWDIKPPTDMPRRAGWETEPIDPGHPWARYVAIVALATLCSVLLSGCGGGDWEEDAPQDPPPNTQPVDCTAMPARCS